MKSVFPLFIILSKCAYDANISVICHGGGCRVLPAKCVFSHPAVAPRDKDPACFFFF